MKRLAATLALAACAGGGYWLAPSGGGDPQPGGGAGGVLVILVDDLGIEHAAPWGVGADPATMPRLDQLAAEGLVFEQAWSNPVCSPTRAGLLTGLYALRHGVGSAVPWLAEGEGLPLDAETLPEMVPSVPVGIFGKWHLGMSDAEGGLDAPRQQGFASAVVTRGNPWPAGESYYGWTWVRDGVEEPASGYLTTATVDEAVAWIGGQVAPWVAVVAFHAPHGPYECPPTELAGCDPAAADVEIMQAMAEALDAETGRLLDAVPDGTTVLWASDNGSPGGVALPPVESGKAKHTAFQGGVRVPMLAWGPGIAPGRVTAPVVLQDLTATVVELVGGVAPVIDGVSLVPCFADAECEPHEFVWTDTFSPNGAGPYDDAWRVARGLGGCKLHRKKGGLQALADLSVDPWETTNLLGAALSPEHEECYDALVDYMMGL